MLDALKSISARPVGAVIPATPTTSGGRGSSGQMPVFGFPGLGDYGRTAHGKVATAPGDTGVISATGQVRLNIGTAFGQVSGETATNDFLHLSPEAEAQLRNLKQRDAEVHAHERAHMAVGGQYVAGGPSYDYQQGPDGRQYAIGGHVSIDASAIPDDPEAGVAKARQIRRAALAPSEPSAQDQAVAAKASAQEARATREKREDTGEDTVPAAEDAPRSALAGTHDGFHAASMRAAETYATMAQRGVMPTALAPGGTGISLQI